MAESAVKIFPAPAKINLRLKIVGRREDGLHLVDSDMIYIDLADEIYFSPRDDGKLRADLADDDLIIRAAKTLRAAGGDKRLGADIRARKNIPVGGGLGGGSSDAATTLIALNNLWRLHFSRQKLTMLGARLGADIPFFLFGRTARVGGVGDQLTAADFAPRYYLLVFPPVQAETRAVFAAYQNRSPAAGGGTENISANDLTAAAMSLYPAIGEAAAILRRRAGRAQMSGSGGALFADFAERQDARRAQLRLPPNLKSAVAKGLSRHPLRNLVQCGTRSDGE